MRRLLVILFLSGAVGPAAAEPVSPAGVSDSARAAAIDSLAARR